MLKSSYQLQARSYYFPIHGLKKPDQFRLSLKLRIPRLKGKGNFDKTGSYSDQTLQVLLLDDHKQERQYYLKEITQ